MDDRPQFILDLSFTDREPAAPLGDLQALARPADEVLPIDDLADELTFLDDYTLAVRSERSADFDDYAPSYADDLDLDPPLPLPSADLEL